MDKLSLDKQKLLEWLKVEIESCEFIGDERDRTIRLECMKIVERINEGVFDSSSEPSSIISPEQREEIQKYLDMPTEHGFMIHAKPAKELVKALLSSEQAWREKYELMEVRMKCYESQSIKNINLAEDYKEQLNQAVERVEIDIMYLKEARNICPKSLSIYKEFVKCIKRSEEFLSSLSKEV